MKVTLILKKSVTRYDTESQATIYARLRDGRQLDLVAPTRLTINPNLWDDKAEQVKSKVVCDEAMRTRYNNEARRLKTYIERAYQNRPEETVSKGWLKEALDQYYNPQKYNLEQVSAIKPTLTALFDEFLEFLCLVIGSKIIIFTVIRQKHDRRQGFFLHITVVHGGLAERDTLCGKGRRCKQKHKRHHKQGGPLFHACSLWLWPHARGKLARRHTAFASLAKACVRLRTKTIVKRSLGGAKFFA